MSRTPPLLPIEAFMRVLRVARFDGMCLLGLSGLFAILAAVGGDRIGAMFGLLAAGAGAIELHGATLLQHADPRGMRWLVSAQCLLMATILAFCVYRMYNIDLALLRAALTPESKAQIAAIGWTEDEFLRFTYRMMWYAIAGLTLLYQGGMIIYYLRRRQAVERAIDEAGA